MSELTITTEHRRDLDACILQPKGVLTRDNRHTLRRTVQQHLAEAPAAIIIDLNDAQVTDQIVGATFVAIRRDTAAHGPGVALLVCGVADPSVASHVQRLLPRQPIFGTLADALQGIDTAPAEGHWTLVRLDTGLQAPFDAMAAVVAACHRWDLSSLAGPARATTFNLCLAAFRCPPGLVTAAAYYESKVLRIGFRVRPDADYDHPPCAPRRQATGLNHKIVAGGHLLWTALPNPASLEPMNGAAAAGT